MFHRLESSDELRQVASNPDHQALKLDGLDCCLARQPLPGVLKANRPTWPHQNVNKYLERNVVLSYNIFLLQYNCRPSNNVKV
jgi:hypothetical protein